MVFICDGKFHTALLRQSSGRERNVFGKAKKSKNTVRGMFTLGFVWHFYVCVKFVLDIVSECVCVCVCMCVIAELK